MQTDGRKFFKYGYFEARIYLPADTDAWPAFWLVGASDNEDEIDILESFRGADWVTQNYHWSGGAEGNAVLVPWATSAWNTYAMSWEPGEVTWYVDGAKVWQVTGRTVFAKDAYLILDLAVDSFQPAARVPATMKVDYVRAWQRIGVGRSPTPG